MGDLLQFRPRSRENADRAFWRGPSEFTTMAIEILEQVTIPTDTSPSEMNPEEPAA